jgi:hypothetical protein
LYIILEDVGIGIEWKGREGEGEGKKGMEWECLLAMTMYLFMPCFIFNNTFFCLRNILGKG